MDNILIDRAVQLLKQGGVVGMPTETVYGLAASIKSHEGIKKIFSLKERPFFDPLIVHISSKGMIKEVTDNWPLLAEVLSNHFWPGPLTLILPKNKKTVDDLITAGLPTVGIRFPSHPMARKLIERLGHPVAAPSANKFKQTSPTCLEHVLEDLGKTQPDLLVLDGGHCEGGIESTIIQIDEEKFPGEIRILRPGLITKEHIVHILEMEGLSDTKIIDSSVCSSITEENNSQIVSPGQMQDHYMPKLPFYLFETQKDFENFKEEGHEEAGLEIKLNPKPELAAREIYSKLRDSSKEKEDGIFYLYLIKENIQKNRGHEENSLWDSIWDRLHKASQKNH